MRITRRPRALEPDPQALASLVKPLGKLKCARLVVVGIAVIHINFDGLVEPGDGSRDIAGLEILLRHSVATEGIRWILFEHFLKEFDASLAHGGRVPLCATLRVMHWIAKGITTAGLLAALLAIAGCLSDYVPVDRTDRRDQEIQITHAVGGTHWRTLVEGGTWYQGFGPVLLALNPKNGAVLNKLACFPVGKSGALVDLVVFHGDLIGLLDRSAVVRIDRTDPGAMMAVESISEKALGIRPEQLSVAAGGLYVSGLGGIVRLDTGERFLAGSDVCGRVVGSALGIVATRKGEIVSLEEGLSHGKATDLAPLTGTLSTSGFIAFVDQGDRSARVGILDGDLHEVGFVEVAGEVSRLREIGERLWAMTPTEIVTWQLSTTGLSDARIIRVKGALDIDLVAVNTYAVAGTFGRALYRLDRDQSGAGDLFFAATREAGRLERVLSDGRRIIAGSPEGNWLYMTGGSCEPSSNPIQTVNPANSTLSGLFGSASIEGADSDLFTIDTAPRVVIRGSGIQQTIQMPQGTHARTLALVANDLWIGHDDGIDIWRFDDAKMVRVGRLRLQGPVTNIFPRRTEDGASWVTIFGGMGVAMWRPVDGTTAAVPSTPPTAAATSAGE